MIGRRTLRTLMTVVLVVPLMTQGTAIASNGAISPAKEKGKEQDKTMYFADANATPETRSLLAYLNRIRGKQVLFGHQHATTEGLSIAAKDGTESEVEKAVGELPGMFGWDTLSLVGDEKPGSWSNTREQNRDNLIKVMKSAYQAGGVLALSAHMPNFVTGNNFYDTKGNVVSHILPGGDKHAAYNDYLDMIADFANNLRDDKGNLIPVIFRPFHEQNGGWFWWGAPYRTKDQYIEIYRYTVEYLRDKKNVHNFLYAFSPGSPFNGDPKVFLETYPGDEFVDILGFDTYYDGTSAGWFDIVVQDAKLVSQLADARGKVAAFTEFGYSGVKPTGTQDLAFFTKLIAALKSDPDAKRMAYMLTWANFYTDNIFVPYRNAPNGLGDHELLRDFVAYYQDPYTAFVREVTGAYTNKMKAAKKKPFLHIASPTGMQTIPATKATTIRARVLDQKECRVTYQVGDEEKEFKMQTDKEGFYYTADWIPGEELDESGVLLTVKSYPKNGTVISETVQVFISDAPEMLDPRIVDQFETYKGSNELLDMAYSPAGDLSSIKLESAAKAEGNYSLRFDYNVSGQGYAGQVKNMEGVDWSGAGKLKLWLKPDGSGNKLVLQINASGISFEAYPSLNGTDAGWLEIPFNEFRPAPWDTAHAGKTMDADNLKDIRSFGIYVNKQEGSKADKGTLYMDDIRVE
ncbi:glycosyl hydrolase [Paenibacillus tarimensis]|uniref:glycosyl hydrolase n=1 Tax=Paenibacillus tarimensis TaxID=416012 RepID=UPI001F44AD32|nr:glycosyl hydrolase [Paenibacillus tarimensis]MCF2946383.1 mannanase [Paenibacillus tarimensis]